MSHVSTLYMYDITEQNRMKTRYLMDTYSTCTCMSIAINKAGCQMLVDGHLLHALVSFGSEDPNGSLPQRASSQFTSSLHGWQTQVEIG